MLLIFLLILVGCETLQNLEYNVDQSACNACGKCSQICQYDAIGFDAAGKAFIDQTKCIQCGECLKICPQKAIF
ncbi:MAG: 4Fe-4S binding protein [Candidatus Cloacimonetes bacterium]|nr:4Fe-4S binding protein [Candidatus Cloacimonadota bacterium]